MNEKQLHAFRQLIDTAINAAEDTIAKEESRKYIREMSLVRTKLQEAKMWVGKCLEVAGNHLPDQYADKSK